MSSILPDASRFETPVYGTIFAARATAVQRLREGDTLILVPDPPGIDEAPRAAETVSSGFVAEEPKVWVHAQGGDVLGHLSPDINRWLVPLMLDGARYSASVRGVGDPGQVSWRRLTIEVRRLTDIIGSG